MLTSTRLLETIKCLDGSVFHLDYHQQRLNYSRSKLGLKSPLILSLDPPKNGLYRCRVLYHESIEKIEYIPYEPKEIKHFKLLHSDISYELKYEDRSDIDALMKKKGSADEIIIIKDGLITDTSIANLCFYDGKEWLTPKDPLLMGTTRQRFLENRLIKEADIPCTQISKFSKIGVLNAMVDFQIIENAIIS